MQGLLEAWAPLGRALWDYFQGDSEATALAHAADREYMEYPAALFFRTPEELPRVERLALSLCRGRVLDAGAGAGCHALPLQERGLEVWALDVLPQAVRILEARGLRHIVQEAILDHREGPYDTILLMMHGIGLTETLGGLHDFLRWIHRLVAPGGQILLDSLDVRETGSASGRYPGEVEYTFEYRGQVGRPFLWLYVDPETLAEIAGETGWGTEILREEPAGREKGRYLARLIRVIPVEGS